MSARRLLAVGLVSQLILCTVVEAEPVGRVLPEGKKPSDRRYEELKTLNGYFPFEVPATAEAWKKRAADVRRQVMLSQGLWPMPLRTTPKATVHGKIERDGFTVERVYLESFPGHFVSGSLFRPVGRSGKLPAVLCPHGHWPNGRFYDVGEKKIQDDIKTGAERYAEGGRSPLQARSMQLARMGCVVFLYDMVGYADSQQIAHRPGVREAMNTATNWGFFSPQAELRLQTMMGLQSYNSVCALDWLLSLPDVDPERVGVTGASGGGTQTFVLCAVDPRPTVAHPAVMVSTSMQGGCTCENAPYLRVGTGNIELAAVFAPKPLSMTAANDWTKELDTKGLPELKQLYALVGAKENVQGVALVQFPHNFNYPSRAVMINWFNKHLRLGLPEPVVEEDYKRLSTEELTVWDDSHPKPPSGDDYERSLLRTMTEKTSAELAALVPQSLDQRFRWREVYGGAWRTMIGRELPPAGAVEYEKVDEHDRGAYLEFTSLLRLAKAGEEVPCVFLLPKQWNKQVVVWVDGQGKQAIYGSDGGPIAEIQKLLKAGCAIAAHDVFGNGEFTEDGKPVARQRLIAGPKIGDAAKYAGYTFGYNHSLFAQRVHDILTTISFVRNHKQQPERVSLVGRNGAGAWVAAACVVAGDAVDAASIDTGGLRFAQLTSFDDPNFVPGSVKYGDVPGLVALAAPCKLQVAGENDAGLNMIRQVYRAFGSPHLLTTVAAGRAADPTDWLLEK